MSDLQTAESYLWFALTCSLQGKGDTAFYFATSAASCMQGTKLESVFDTFALYLRTRSEVWCSGTLSTYACRHLNNNLYLALNAVTAACAKWRENPYGMDEKATCDFLSEIIDVDKRYKQS